MTLFPKFCALFRRKRLEAEMAEEMREHLVRRAEANLAKGMSLEEASNSARRQFGHLEGLKEIARDQRGLLWWEDFVRDARLAVRAMRKNRGFTAATLLMLALGIGLVTVQFSFINGTL